MRCWTGSSLVDSWEMRETKKKKVGRAMTESPLYFLSSFYYVRFLLFFWEDLGVYGNRYQPGRTMCMLVIPGRGVSSSSAFSFLTTWAQFKEGTDGMLFSLEGGRWCTFGGETLRTRVCK